MTDAPALFIGSEQTGYYLISDGMSYLEIRNVMHYVLGTVVRDTILDNETPTP